MAHIKYYIFIQLITQCNSKCTNGQQNESIDARCHALPKGCSSKHLSHTFPIIQGKYDVNTTVLRSIMMMRIRIFSLCMNVCMGNFLSLIFTYKALETYQLGYYECEIFLKNRTQFHSLWPLLFSTWKNCKQILGTWKTPSSASLQYFTQD